MTNAERILRRLDERLDAPVELTLYGRGALQLGFERPRSEYATSRDIDAVLWTGQAEDMLAHTNFWEALEEVNKELAPEGLFASHLFTEDQVILSPDWRSRRVPIPGPWRRLILYRLGDADLLLSKLMRDDPADQEDARFIVARAGFSRADVEAILARARIPEAVEIREQFGSASARLLRSLGAERDRERE